MRRIPILLTAVLLFLTIAGCSANNEPAEIAATTLPVYEFTSLLCEGTGIRVSRLITEEVSCLHDYSLQVKQMQTIENAEMIVISGAGLEDFLGDVITEKNNVVDASVGITLHHAEDEHDHEEHTHEDDPHIWLAPANAKIMAKNIYNALSAKYPQHASIIDANFVKLNERFDNLISYAATELTSLKSRDLVTFHDGFRYMAEAFDLNILHAITEESGREASAAELIELIGIVSQNNVPAIFTEKHGSVSAASVIAAETGSKTYALDMAMSGNSYFNAMYYNIKTLKEALQ